MFFPLQNLPKHRFETIDILKQVSTSNRKLAELKGAVSSIPNEAILINTLGLQEAKDSSAVENIVTTHDEIFRSAVEKKTISLASKEVLRYNEALSVGFNKVDKTGLLTTNDLCEIQSRLEPNKAGLRKIPGTNLKNNMGEVIYTPPQGHPEIIKLLDQLEQFINDNSLFEADPLIKMALIHHRFESIHPFFDGNGRTGRILNVLYLVKENLLDIPVLYLSRYIVQNKSEYYALLQDVRDNDMWEKWVLFILKAVESTAEEGIKTIKSIKELLLDTKQRIRKQFSFYSQDLINNLFKHPYTKINFLQSDLNVTRVTATKYLEKLVEAGLLHKITVGRNNYYINSMLVELLTG